MADEMASSQVVGHVPPIAVAEALEKAVPHEV
jgi:hypothetical protein